MNTIKKISQNHERNAIEIDVPYMAMIGAGDFYLGQISSSIPNPTFTFSGWDSDLYSVDETGRLLFDGGLPEGIEDYFHQIQITATSPTGTSATETFQIDIKERPDPEYLLLDGQFIVYSSDVTIRNWMDFYNSVNDISFYDYDHEEINPQWIVIPKTWMNIENLPTLSPQRAKVNFAFEYGVKDIMLTDNPSFINGAEGSLKAEFEKLVLDAHALGAETIEVIQWTSGKIEENGTHSMFPFSTSIFPLQNADLEHLTRFAKNFEIDVTVTQQIQYYTTEPDETGFATAFVPEHTSENIQKWMDAYKQHLTTVATNYEAFDIGRMDITNGTGTLNFVFDDGSNSEIYRTGFREIISELNKIYTGELVLLDSFLLVDEFIRENIDAVIVEINLDFADQGLEDDQVTAEIITQSIIDSGKITRIEQLGKIFPEVVVTFTIQSRNDAFTNPGYIEETMCTSKFYVNQAGIIEEEDGCMQLETEVDFALQARAYRGVLDALSTVITDAKITLSSKENWITENILGSNVFPNIGGGTRNKPAETLLYDWFKSPIELNLSTQNEKFSITASLDETFSDNELISFELDLSNSGLEIEYVEWAGAGGVETFENIITVSNIDLGNADLTIVTSTQSLDNLNDKNILVEDVLIGQERYSGTKAVLYAMDVEQSASITIFSKTGKAINDYDVTLVYNYGEFSETKDATHQGLSTKLGIQTDVIVNKDMTSFRSITSQDALEALRLSVGMETSMGSKTPHDYIAADFNQDGRVTSSDALAILQYSVGLTSEYAPEWIFIDDADGQSHVDRGNVSFLTGVELNVYSATNNIILTGILIGDVNDSHTDIIA